VNEEVLKDLSRGDMRRHVFWEDLSGCYVKNGLDMDQRGCRAEDQLGVNGSREEW
jgi:hypothetical protein